MKRITKAVIPAAGLGTRFLPATKAVPKEMLPIVDKPTIQYLVEEAVAAGIREILVVLGRNKQCVEDHFDRAPELEALLEAKGQRELLETVRDLAGMAHISFVRQRQALGLGHAVGCARFFAAGEPFAVMLGDNVVHSHKPALAQMMEVYDATGASVLAVQDVPDEQVSRFGIVGTQAVPGMAALRVTSLVEKPKLADAPSNTAIYGRYIITPRIFDLLERQAPGAGGEIQLTDALLALLEQEAIYALRLQGTLYDVGDKLGFLQATVEYALRGELGPAFLQYLKTMTQEGNS